MAENANKNVEEVFVPVTEQLELMSLFSPDETRAIINRARNFEYKLVKMKKDKMDYLNYVTFLAQLVELVKSRREKTRIWMRKADVEDKLVLRAHHALMSATLRFSGDLSLWMTNVNLCIHFRRCWLASKVFVDMLHYHAAEQSIWVAAAKLEFEHLDSPRNARGLFMQALKQHPDSLLINKEYFRFELLNSLRLRQDLEDMTKLNKSGSTEDNEENANDLEHSEDEMLNGKLAGVVVDNFIKNRPLDFELFAAIFRISGVFQFAAGITARISQHMERRFQHNERYWHIRIQQCQSEGRDQLQQVCDLALSACPTATMYDLAIEALLCKASNIPSPAIASRYFRLAQSYFMQAVSEESCLISEETALTFLPILAADDRSQAESLLFQITRHKQDFVRLRIHHLESLLDRDKHQPASDYLQNLLSQSSLVNNAQLWTLLTTCLEKRQENFPHSLAKKVRDLVWDCQRRRAVQDKECERLFKRCAVLMLSLGECKSSCWSDVKTLLQLPPVDIELLQSILNLPWLTNERTKWLFETFCRFIGSESIQVWTLYRDWLFSIEDFNQAHLCNDRALRTLNPRLASKYFEETVAAARSVN